ncbi:hypothetical protein AAGR22_12410 [Erwinia sp. HDF1-3R]|uniref:hypothetical protein n=1 Tax=Erwinia sp. HDF1-3R TaxID=3141543 RepID=UPI0031F5071B
MFNPNNNQQNHMNTSINASVSSPVVPSGVVAFEYDSSISNLPQCPPACAQPLNKDCWRFTLNPHTPNCFWPPARRSPMRVAKNDYEACAMWALSMYESEPEATEAYSKLKKSIKNIEKAIGDHLSHGFVTTNDGECTPPNHAGHFDFHPYVSSAFPNNFNITSKLP